MNSKVIIILLCFFTFSNALISQQQHKSFSQFFNDFEIVQVNPDLLLDQINSQTFNGELDVFLSSESNFSVELQVSKVFSEDYYVKAGEIERFTAPDIHTFKGSLKSDVNSRVRLTLAEDFIYGFFEIGKKSTIYIEPAYYYNKAFDKSWYVIYNSNDVKKSAPDWCAATEHHERKFNTKGHQEESRNTGNCYEIELAIASDYSMYTKYNSSISDVEAHSAGVMNNVQANYDDEFADELQFLIVEQWISDCSSCDPWTSSTNASTLLASFRGWGPNGFSQVHDIGQLWTNRNFDGSTVGIAYVGAVCLTNWRYHCLSDFTTNAEWLRVMTAHEIGHNFDATHDPSGSNTIMGPTVSSATAWSAASITDIENYYNSVNCLSACPPPVPPTSDFSANYTNICLGSAIQFIDESVDNPNTWLWTFQAGTPGTSNDQFPVITYNTPGTFNVTLETSNANGSDITTKSGYITVGSNGTEILLYDNFENGLSQWTIDNPDGFLGWTSNTAGGSIAGDGIAKIDNYNYNSPGQKDALISPVIDLTGRANAQLDFLYAYARYGANNADSLNVWVSTNGGSSFNNLVFASAENGSGNFATVPDDTNPFTPGQPSHWCYASSYLSGGCISIDLSSFINEPNLVFKIENVTDYGNNLYIDNVTFTSACQNILPPVADFISDVQSGCVILDVNFFDLSENLPDTWFWQFPGGTPGSSVSQNPTVSYTGAGNYDVTLTVTNISGSSTITKPLYIDVNDSPVADFTTTIINDFVSFTNTTLNGSTYVWEFGDGNFSTEENPNHVYESDGVYTVVLIATNECGASSYSTTITIITPPVAGFTSDITSGCAPQAVQYTDQSSSNVDSWFWEFEGGSPATSTDQNPIILYTSAGIYNTKLTVTNAAGSHIILETDYMVVNEYPTADFNFTVDDLTVDLSNSSISSDSYYWEFGDGENSTEINPTHVYDVDGSYYVMLISTNICGNDTIIQSVEISTLPSASASANVTNGCIPLTVQFTDQSSSNVDNWFWTFEGGSPGTSTAQNPQVIYGASGTFDVVLEVSNENGSDILVLTDYITIDENPNAGFTFTPIDLEVDFQNNSTFSNAYYWDFGDAEFSIEEHPTHMYDEDGTYIVSLISTNSCGSDTVIQVVTIVSPPQAGFNSDISSGCIPMSVQFTDASSQNVDVWTWSFEGGNPAVSTDQNPLIEYMNAGSFDVQLIVSNSMYSDTLNLENYVSVGAPPNSSFNSQSNDLLVNFQNTSGNASTYSWAFGDGEFSSEVNPSHSYGMDGTYTVTLISTNNCGSDTSIQIITVVSPPSANFSANNTSGCLPFIVQYSDESSANVDTWFWTFEGGNPALSNDENPTVTYESAGVFDVQLIVSNTQYSDTISFEQFISVDDIPTAGFQINTDGADVDFTNISTNANTYFWDFGDDETSSEMNPSHIYDEEGSYTVMLIAQNGCGNDTIIQQINASSIPTAGFQADATSGCLPMDVQFMNLSTLNATSWEWTFEGGFPATSTQQHPLVSYSNEGIYDVQLIAISQAGSDTLIFEDYIEVLGLPIAGFDATIDGNEVTYTNGSSGADSYFWDFGNLDGSTNENPTTSFDSDGDYNTLLIASNACGQDSFEMVITITAFPNAGFSSDESAGCVPLEVQFMDNSTDNVNAWMWEFEGGNPSISIEQNPMVSYDTPGTYKVSLTAINGVGDNSLTLLDYVIVGESPIAGFDFNAAQDVVSFQNMSDNAISYLWDFGDDETSEEIDPDHIYTESGTYEVVLIAINEFCSDTISQFIEVEVTAVNNIPFVETLIISPNPASDIVFIELKSSESKVVQVEIMNLLGQRIYMNTWKIELNVNRLDIDVSSFPSSSYLIRIHESEHSIVQKLIIE